MEGTEKYLSPQDSLDLITDVIVKTKVNVRENSRYFLLWGWLIAVASFSYFLLQHYSHFRYYFIPFPILSLTGIIVTVYWYWKRSHVATETYLVYFLSRLWLALGICFLVVVTATVHEGVQPFIFTLVLAAIGTLVSGLVMKFTPLVIGGGLFLIAAYACILAPESVRVLIHGAAIVTGYLIPGYLLKYAKGLSAHVQRT